MEQYCIMAQLEQQQKMLAAAQSESLRKYHESRIEALERDILKFEEAAKDLPILVQEIFRQRVLHSQTWENISETVGYSRDSIYRIRRKWISHFRAKGIIL